MAASIHEQLQRIVGNWSGIARLWFEPDKLANESAIAGSIESITGTSILRYRYSGTILGRTHQGEEWITFNCAASRCEVAWHDDFHMNYGILFSTGSLLPNGYSVRGSYAVGGDQPKWGWRTDLNILNDDQIEFLAYNITPTGEEALATHIQYQRIPLSRDIQ